MDKIQLTGWVVAKEFAEFVLQLFNQLQSNPVLLGQSNLELLVQALETCLCRASRLTYNSISLYSHGKKARLTFLSNFHVQVV